MKDSGKLAYQMGLVSLLTNFGFMKAKFVRDKKTDKAKSLTVTEVFLKVNLSKDYLMVKVFSQKVMKFSLENGLVINVYYQIQFLITLIANFVIAFLTLEQLMWTNIKTCVN